MPGGVGDGDSGVLSYRRVAGIEFDLLRSVAVDHRPLPASVPLKEISLAGIHVAGLEPERNGEWAVASRQGSVGSVLDDVGI